MGYVINAEVCWSSSAKVHSTIGRLSMESVYIYLRYVCGILSFGATIMGSGQYRVRGWSGGKVNTTNSSRCIKMHIFRLNFIILNSVGFMRSSVLHAWGIINAVLANGLVPGCVQPLTDTA